MSYYDRPTVDMHDKFLYAIFGGTERFHFSDGEAHCLLCGAHRPVREMGIAPNRHLADDLDAHVEAHWRSVAPETAAAFLSALDMGVSIYEACRQFFGATPLVFGVEWKAFWRKGAPL